VPVCLVGHSLGGRVALQLADHRLVCAVCALAPWIVQGDPGARLAGCSVLVVHGDRDRVTSVAGSLTYARRAAAAGGDVRTVLLAGGGHAMLRHALVWQRLARAFVLHALGVAVPLPAPLAGAPREVRI